MRPRLFLILFALLIPIGSHAQKPPKSAQGKQQQSVSLTPKQISEGWIQLFDGQTDYGWISRAEGTWRVVDGTLLCDAGKEGVLGTTTEFGDIELHFEVCHANVGQAGIALRAPIDVPLDASHNSILSGLKIGKKTSVRTDTAIPSTKFTWVKYDLIQRGSSFEGKVDGGPIGTAIRPEPSRGHVSLFSDGTRPVQFRNIRVRPLGLKSVFNGKDLTGWLSPEGNKSVFSVTKEGWLNVHNGRGDLQTIAQWGDFVLQIEVYSNGDHLNSGVFFRAEPGKFQQGYEDQIRNQWEGEDRSKPVDYGTGAVYNRMPVRKVVSSDREWFTMTLVAHGTHIASWVNGVLVCDFTDTRPVDQTNARKGARTRAGVISLQGHDPTTDLDFRNIRIAELPAVGK